MVLLSLKAGLRARWRAMPACRRPSRYIEGDSDAKRKLVGLL